MSPRQHRWSCRSSAREIDFAVCVSFPEWVVKNLRIMTEEELTAFNFQPNGSRARTGFSSQRGSNVRPGYNLCSLQYFRPLCGRKRPSLFRRVSPHLGKSPFGKVTPVCSSSVYSADVPKRDTVLCVFIRFASEQPNETLIKHVCNECT